MIARLLSPAGPLLCLVLLFPACQSSGDRGADLPTGEAATRAAHEEVGFDVDHYSLDVTLDPEARAIEGRCAIRFVATREGLTAVRLDLEELRVSDAVDERGQRLNFMQSNGSVKIELRSPLEVGDLGEVEVTYGGTPRKGVWFVGDDGTTGPTHVFTQGECEDARFWFPCRDVPADRATHDLNVTMPADWRSVAGGERNGESTSREQRSESWSMRFPLPTYLFTLVAGEEMERYEDSWEDVPLAFVSPKEHSGWLTESLADTDEALAFLEDFAGREYPFTKYTQCCVEDFPFGGMENASATTLTVAALGDERYLRDTPATSLVVHEAAHQWFGDLLTCATWPHIWLNEGFATYCALLFVEETEGRDAFLTELRDIQEAYIRGDSGANRRAIVSDVYKDPIDLFFGGHTYQGGASRLHLLRHVLGEEDFRAGVHRYVSLHENRGVVTSDLRRAFEEASERDLERFFDQWLLSPGHPVFETRWRWDAQGSRVLLTVDQVQDVGDGTPTAFEAPVDIEIRTQSDATLHRVQLTKRRHLFQIPVDPALDGEPLWVRFDAQGALPKEHYAKKSPEEWV
ncbi:MAG: M1 family metallopeptidase, partial [Planctomycetota bacterium]